MTDWTQPRAYIVRLSGRDMKRLIDADFKRQQESYYAYLAEQAAKHRPA